ncbi:MAG: hypothetical protein R2838_02250 [Caldilineaceae bacterium]
MMTSTFTASLRHAAGFSPHAHVPGPPAQRDSRTGGPPSQLHHRERAASEERVFAFFSPRSAADAACVAEYGDLETRFFDLVDALNAQPVELAHPPPDGGRMSALRSTATT